MRFTAEKWYPGYCSVPVLDFEQETGIEVELITGGTSELLKRIESEGMSRF